jgi:hypothetical protein
MMGLVHRFWRRGDWKKSSLSGYHGNCVEVAGVDKPRADGMVLMRNTTDRNGIMLMIPAQEWDDLIEAVKRGELDRVKQPVQ